MSRKTITTQGSGDLVGEGNVVVQYRGIRKEGERKIVFDENKNFTFTVGQGHVIKCWDDQISQMKVGETATIVCPASTAYGDREIGPIPANSDLTFEVTVKSKQ